MSIVPEHPAGPSPASSATRGWTAFLLCGGFGTRLRSVTDRPKAVLDVAGWPFLRFQIELLESRSPERIVFLTGYGSEEVERSFGPGTERRVFSREERPLGTGGALAQSKALASERNWIGNGDSFTDIDPESLLSHAHPSLGLVLAVRVPDRSDYGGLGLGPDGQILAFDEKGQSGPGWINAGIYLLPRLMLMELPEGESSLERDHLPRWASEGRLRAHTVETYFIDIGTPERLRRANEEFVQIRRRLEA